MRRLRSKSSNLKPKEYEIVGEIYKQCPFCAEKILFAAKVCKHCGRDLPIATNIPKYELLVEEADAPREKSPLIKYWWVFLLILFFVISLFGMPRSVGTSSIVQQESLSVCGWFREANDLRLTRISGLNNTGLIELVNKIGSNSSFSAEESQAIVQAILKYEPYLEKFIEDWKRLGFHPDSLMFWNKELESNVLRLQGIQLMKPRSSTTDNFVEGLEMFFSASDPGQEADILNLDLYDQCN